MCIRFLAGPANMRVAGVERRAQRSNRDVLRHGCTVTNARRSGESGKADCGVGVCLRCVLTMRAFLEVASGRNDLLAFTVMHRRVGGSYVNALSGRGEAGMSLKISVLQRHDDQA